MVIFCRGHTDIKCGEQCEYIRLNPSNKQLDQINKQNNQRHTSTYDITMENKCQTNQT